MSYLTHLECTSCGTRLPADRLQNNICADGGVLEARYDIDRLRREISREAIAQGPASLWRYAPFLPVAEPAAAPSLGEGFTPMLPARRLERESGCAELWLKDEGQNPTGSFKDRGAAVAVARMRELGVGTVTHNSSGNAAGAWALYCARAGIGCVALVPDDILAPSLQQVALSGTQAYMLDGPWQEGGPLVARSAEANGWFLAGTLKEPYRLEGKKTMGFEIAEQLGWSLPDAIVYPTGGGLGPIGIYKAFRELAAMGWIDGTRLPKLIVVQWEGCAPIVRAWREGEKSARPWENIDILPGGLKSATPPGDRAVLEIVCRTGGTCVTATTEEGLEAVARLARREGVFACPESATTLVGLEKAMAEGAVAKTDRVVLMITGSDLKSVPNFPTPSLPCVSGEGSLPA